MGYVGLIINGCWVQMADAMTGWFGLDIAGDDGYKYGRWPWQTNRRMIARGTGVQGAPPAAEMKPKVEEKPKPKAEAAPKTEEKPKPKTETPTTPK